MNPHGLFRTDEPPGGDYVRYIESLAGPPPADVERAARELARRLERGEASAGPAVNEGVTRAEAPTGAAGTARAGRGGMRQAPGLRQALSRALVVIGALLLGLGLLAPEAIPLVPGLVLLVAGLAIGRKAGHRPGRTTLHTDS